MSSLAPHPTVRLPIHLGNQSPSSRANKARGALSPSSPIGTHSSPSLLVWSFRNHSQFSYSPIRELFCSLALLLYDTPNSSLRHSLPSPRPYHCASGSPCHRLELELFQTSTNSRSFFINHSSLEALPITTLCLHRADILHTKV